MAAVREDDVDAWVRALVERHTGSMTRPQFLKAIRALSARYVERRAELPHRRAIDSRGKRAAFAAFYAALHFLTVREVVRRTALDRVEMDHVMDLGCGTGVAGAAWSLACPARPPVVGIDSDRWALDEARWNWNFLGVNGRVKVLDMSKALTRPPRGSTTKVVGVVAAWSLNEVVAPTRANILESLVAHAGRGGPVLVIEPLSRSAVPWWDDWAARVLAAGGRADEWRLSDVLPPQLADLSEAAGFRREALTARSTVLSDPPPHARS